MKNSRQLLRGTNMKYEESLISIVIPVYNAEKYIAEAIECILRQTYQNWELIFVDDSSADRSIEIIEGYLQKDRRLHLYRLHVNSGPAIARNIGIMKAAGRYLAFMDADDLCSKDKLEKQLSFMQEKQCAFCYTGYCFADESGTTTGSVVHIPERLTYAQALKNTTISTITVMFDREKIPVELLHMPVNTSGEDTATWWRILRNGYDAYGIDEPLSTYRRYSGTRSSNKFRAVTGTWRMYRINEHIGLLRSIYYFCCYIKNAVKRRLPVEHHKAGISL